MKISIHIDGKDVCSSPKRTEYAGDVLAWLTERFTDEETGDEPSPKAVVLRALLEAKARLQARDSDAERRGSGKLAGRLYSPDLRRVEAPPAVLVKAVETLEKAEAEVRPPPAKPAKQPSEARQPSKPASGMTPEARAARIAELEAILAKRLAAETTPRAVAPTVRKGGKGRPGEAAPSGVKVHVPGAKVVGQVKTY
jgi:hypothetical protein